MSDFEKLSNTEYYYVYKKYGKENKIDRNVVEASLEKILNGNLNDVVNRDTTLGMSDKLIENDIFWDVNNNINFVQGNNLKKTIYLYIVFVYNE